MICYRDMTFCTNAACKCGDGRRLTSEIMKKAKAAGLPVSMADLCGAQKPKESK